MPHPNLTPDNLVQIDLWPHDLSGSVTDPDCTWNPVDFTRGAEYRWFTEYLFTITNGEEFWQHVYLVDNSESQDGQFDEFERWKGDWYQVRPVEKTIVVYERVS